MHKLRVVAFDGVVPFDLCIPLEVFARTRLADGRLAYDVAVCGARPTARAAAFQLGALGKLAELESADTIVVPGIDDIGRRVPPTLLKALVRAHQRGARIASICSGAFVLAAAGLLDGRRATTHWLAADALTAAFPKVMVEPNALYVDEGTILTSAGAAAGLDLCLHMVRRDHGAAVALAAARLSVVPLVREGGQAQFAATAATPQPAPGLEPVLRWIDANLGAELDVAKLARRAAMSPRTFLRRFQEQTGTSPARWVAEARVRRAQALLESSTLTVDEVAGAVGFGSGVTFRQRFAAVVGVSPQRYRRSFRAA
jgi:transcriptional regulator GlxA family with amidase domain